MITEVKYYHNKIGACYCQGFNGVITKQQYLLEFLNYWVFCKFPKSSTNTVSIFYSHDDQLLRADILILYINANH